MWLRIKRLFVRLLIQIIKAGAITTYYTKRALRPIATPAKKPGRVFLHRVLVPLYRGVFFVRRSVNKVYIPGKHKLMYLLTNRYAIHGLVVVLVFATTAVSVQASGVRSDDVGKQSMLYEIVTGESEEVIAVRADSISSAPSRYLGTAALSVQPDIDYDLFLEDTIATTSGGSAIIAPTIAEASESVAPRTEAFEYTVQSGDTISTIAGRHGIKIDTLLWANGLSVRSVLQPGDDLTILPVDGVTHTVKSGDTVLALARKYGAEASEISSYNHLGDSSSLSIGEKLIIPGGTRIAAAPVSRSVSKVFSAPTTSTAPANVSSSGSMAWPTDLRTITQYFGWRHNGLDVDCHFTHNNYAADDGYVQYSGWKGGYGLAVEINHGNGIVTRYGHGATNYVSAGEYVSKGQAIQLCGTTGKSTGTHIHFEVIVNGKYKNPLDYIR